MLSEYSFIQPQPQRRKGLAIVSFLLGIISALILQFFVRVIISDLPLDLLVPEIIIRRLTPDLLHPDIIIVIFLPLGLSLVGAIVLGSVALKKIQKEPAVYGGKGIAIAGIIISASPYLLIAIFFTFSWIRNLRPSREIATIKALISIRESESQFCEKERHYGTLKELGEAGYLDSNYANGVAVGGYIYTYRGGEGYCVQATRQSPSTASRDFYLDGGDLNFVESKTPSTVACGGGTLLGI
jgi:hypothetical protein